MKSGALLHLLRSIGLVALPIVVLVAGGALMNGVAGRMTPADPAQPGKTLTPLNQRYFGYDADDMTQYWKGLDAGGVDAERRFLRYDLVFPVIFAATLAVSLWLAARSAGVPRPPAWLFALLGIGTIADWTENLVQLRLLNSSGITVDSFLARVASAATITKLWSESFLVLVVAVYAVRSFAPSGGAGGGGGIKAGRPT